MHTAQASTFRTEERKQTGYFLTWRSDRTVNKEWIGSRKQLFAHFQNHEQSVSLTEATAAQQWEKYGSNGWKYIACQCPSYT